MAGTKTVKEGGQPGSHRYDSKLIGLALICVEAAPDGIDILPPDSVQLAHAQTRIDQNTD